MIRVFVVYEEEPEPERFEQHAELCREVEGGTFRHGKVFGAPMGEPRFKHYAEWEFPDMDAFKAAADGPPNQIGLAGQGELRVQSCSPRGRYTLTTSPSRREQR